MRQLLLTLLLSVAAFAQMPMGGVTSVVPTLVAPTRVQTVGCGGVAGSIVCTPAAVTGGNTAVVMGLGNSSTCTTATGTGYNFQLWQTVTVSGSNRHSIFIARNITGGSTTVTLNCTGTNSGGIFYELAPAAGQVVAGDVIGSATGTGGTPSVSTTNGVGVSAEEVIATLYDNSNYRTLTAGTGYTMQKRINDSAGSSRSNCTTTCLAGSEDNNTKTGLTGTQTASITGISTDVWNMSILGLASTPAQDAADTIVTFEGLSNGVNPTVAHFNASTFGVPLVWDTSVAGTVMTGDTAALLATVNSHQIGATAYQSGGSLGISYTLVGGSSPNTIYAAFPTGYPTVSYLEAFRTTLPQNDTNGHAYTWHQFDDSSAAADYLAPQLQANGSALSWKLECKSGPSSGSVAQPTNTLTYLQVIAGTNGANSSFKLFDATGAQLGSTLTCASQAGTQSWYRVRVGINGAETMGTGSKLETDMLMLSYTGAALVP